MRSLIEKIGFGTFTDVFRKRNKGQKEIEMLFEI